MIFVEIHNDNNAVAAAAEEEEVDKKNANEKKSHSKDNLDVFFMRQFLHVPALDFCFAFDHRIMDKFEENKRVHLRVI